MRNRLMTAALIISLMVVSIPLSAHHGNAAFDTGKKVTVKGNVTEWTWGNPHIYLKIDVKDEKGNVAHWVAEASNPAAMMSRGWNVRDVKVGDEVTLTMIVAKNGAPVGRVQQLVLADGRKLGGDAGNAATER
ncbi:MAG: hypothetical protein DMG31_08150 [Acidobacteria bacterium]|nr:MAG: hypothetical protein DMG31_08150 [Acidobacteriota bacterium]